MIYLVRHGRVANPGNLVYARLPGFGLDEVGEQQARQVAEYLGSRPVGSIWSSPPERTLRTATPLADRLRLPIKVDPELTEWRLTDRWQGHPWSGLPRLFPGELEAYLNHPTRLDYATESLSDLAARMEQAVRRICELEPSGEVVVFSHQDPVQAARLSLTGRDLSELQLDKPGHASVITLQPGNPWQEIEYWEPPDPQS